MQQNSWKSRAADPMASAADLAAAVKTIIQNNSNLWIGTVAALTSAAIEENPAAAADVAGAATEARPDDAVQITRAAVQAAPTQTAAIAAAAAVAVVAAGGDIEDVGEIVANAVEAAADEGVIVDDGDVADKVSNQTGLHEDEILEEAAVASIEEDAVVTDVADVDDDGNFDDENPSQDSSPT